MNHHTRGSKEGADYCRTVHAEAMDTVYVNNDRVETHRRTVQIEIARKRSGMATPTVLRHSLLSYLTYPDLGLNSRGMVCTSPVSMLQCSHTQ
jgi:hypothetical protein